MTLSPQIAGTLPLHSSPAAFIRAIRDRVTAGLLGPNLPRSRYAIAESSGDIVRIHAVEWQTAINIGLNELDLGFRHSGRIDYTVRYWRWAAYVLGLSGGMGLIGLALLVGLDVRGYIASHPATRLPGLSVEHRRVIEVRQHDEPRARRQCLVP